MGIGHCPNFMQWWDDFSRHPGCQGAVLTQTSWSPLFSTLYAYSQAEILNPHVWGSTRDCCGLFPLQPCLRLTWIKLSKDFLFDAAFVITHRLSQTEDLRVFIWSLRLIGGEYLSRKTGIVCLINVKEGKDYPSSVAFLTLRFKWARANLPNPPNCLWLFLHRNKKDLSSSLTLKEDLMIFCVCVSLPFLFLQEQQNASQILAWKYATLEALCSLGCRWFVHVRLIAAFWFITACADVFQRSSKCAFQVVFWGGI